MYGLYIKLSIPDHEALYYVEIPVKDLASNEKNAITRMRVPMILPHELLNYLTVPLVALSLYLSINKFIYIYIYNIIYNFFYPRGNIYYNYIYIPVWVYIINLYIYML